MNYTQLTQEKRYQIEEFRKAGWARSAIAVELKVNKSTISRELKRNRGLHGYRPVQAHHKAKERQRERASRPRISAATWHFVKAKLQEQWSPEQIAGRLRRQSSQSSQLGRVSHESIYQRVYADKKAGDCLFSRTPLTLYLAAKSAAQERGRGHSSCHRTDAPVGRPCANGDF